MDCNLEKIRDVNIYDIQHGNFEQAIYEAKDYLYKLLGGNKIGLIYKELDNFINHIRTYHVSQTNRN